MRVLRGAALVLLVCSTPAQAMCINVAELGAPAVWEGCSPDESIMRHNVAGESYGFATFALRSSGEMFWGPGGDTVPDINLSRRHGVDGYGNNTLALSVQTTVAAMSRLSWRNASVDTQAAAAVTVQNRIGGAMLLVTGENATHYLPAGLWPNEAAVTSDSPLNGLVIENSTAGGYIRFVKNTQEVARFDHEDTLQLHAGLAHRGSTAGFYNALPVTRPIVTGALVDGTALVSLLQALRALGLIDDHTTDLPEPPRQ